MAEIDLFHYSPAPSPIKNLDPRIKFPLLLLYTILVYHVHSRGLVFIAVFALFLFIMGKPPLKHLLSEGKGILFLGALLFAATYGAAKDTAAALFSVLRFLTTILFGMSLVSTTLPEEIEKAVFWFLRPLPFIPASTMAARIRLTILFIPELMDTVREIEEARISRCIQQRRNPVKRMTTLVIPLMYTIIKRSEATALAMEARCYTDKKDYTFHPFTLKDAAAGAAGLCAAGLSILL